MIQRSTYSNFEQARQQFWEDTFLLGTRTGLLPLGGVLDSLRADDERRAALVRDLLDAATEMTNSAPCEGLDADEAMAIVNSVRWADRIIAVDKAVAALRQYLLWGAKNPKRSELAEEHSIATGQAWMRHFTDCPQCSDPDATDCQEGLDLHAIAQHWQKATFVYREMEALK